MEHSASDRGVHAAGSSDSVDRHAMVVCCHHLHGACSKQHRECDELLPLMTLLWVPHSLRARDVVLKAHNCRCKRVQEMMTRFDVHITKPVNASPRSPAFGVMNGLAAGSQVAAKYAGNSSVERLEAAVAAVLDASLQSGSKVSTSIVQSSSVNVYCRAATDLDGLESADLVAGLTGAGADSVAIRTPMGPSRHVRPWPRPARVILVSTRHTCRSVTV